MSQEQLHARIVSRETKGRLELYVSLLKKWQKAINLVAHSTLDDAWARHIEDSLQLLPHIPEGAVVADLGAGGGFPGLVLAIARTDLTLHLVESDQRKAQFLRTVSRETGAKAQIHNARVEDVLPSLSPDVITARGFAPLPVLLDYAWPAVEARSETQFVLLKGRQADDEIAQARTAYQFAAQALPSLTEPDAKIVMISAVHKLA